MRNQTNKFVDKFLIDKELKEQTHLKVLEVGSLNVNGEIRTQLKDFDYLGTDMREGSGVDLVINGHDLMTKWTAPTFDIVMCFDTLEHDDKFWETVQNMRGVLKPGGWLLIGVPGRNCPLHDHPSDYWRFMRAGLDTFFLGFEEIYVDEQVDAEGRVETDEIYGWGRKPL